MPHLEHMASLLENFENKRWGVSVVSNRLVIFASEDKFASCCMWFFPICIDYFEATHVWRIAFSQQARWKSHNG
jgi:hypothetical protein